MPHWTFRDFLDEAGRNVIRQWLDEQPPGAQMRIDAFIRSLETMRRLGPPYVKLLKGPCRGLLELRIYANRIQYRPLAYYGPERHVVTILYGAIEKGGRFEPRDACEIALGRKVIVENDPNRSREHEFD